MEALQEGCVYYEISQERPVSQDTFEIILVSGHICMVVAIVVETVMIVCASFKQNTEELDTPIEKEDYFQRTIWLELEA